MKIKLFVVLAIIVVSATFLFRFQTNKTYKGGNIFHVPLYEADKSRIPSPWIINGMLSMLMHRTLFTPDSSLTNLSPDLASGYERLDGGTTYKITLKEDTLWSDGHPFTADDVLFSLDAIMKTPRSQGIYMIAFNNIKSTEAEGNVITIKLNEPSTLFLSVLAQFTFIPKHILENADMENLYVNTFWDNPVVLGMYKIASNNEKDYWKLDINPYYNKEKPKIKHVHVHKKEDTGKLDYYYTNNVAEMLNFRAMRGYTEYAVPMLFFRYLVFNMYGDDGFQNPAMQDIRVRKAIAHALNRRKMLNSIYYNMGDIINGTGVKDVGPYEYNPTKAEALLAESGYDLDRPLRLMYYYGDETSLHLVQQIASDLEAVGFSVDYTQAGGHDTLYKEREYDILLKGLAAFERAEWFHEYSSQHPILTKILGDEGEFDDYISSVREETDPLKYDALLNELLKLEREKLYKQHLFSLHQSIYINTDRVIIPEDFVFGNAWYNSNLDFANWEIKQE